MLEIIRTRGKKREAEKVLFELGGEEADPNDPEVIRAQSIIDRYRMQVNRFVIGLLAATVLAIAIPAIRHASQEDNRPKVAQKKAPINEEIRKRPFPKLPEREAYRLMPTFEKSEIDHEGVHRGAWATTMSESIEKSGTDSELATALLAAMKSPEQLEVVVGTQGEKNNPLSNWFLDHAVPFSIGGKTFVSSPIHESNIDEDLRSLTAPMMWLAASEIVASEGGLSFEKKDVSELIVLGQKWLKGAIFAFDMIPGTVEWQDKKPKTRTADITHMLTMIVQLGLEEVGYDAHNVKFLEAGVYMLAQYVVLREDKYKDLLGDDMVHIYMLSAMPNGIVIDPKFKTNKKNQ